jgi:hypothetical protein
MQVCKNYMGIYECANYCYRSNFDSKGLFGLGLCDYIGFYTELYRVNMELSERFIVRILLFSTFSGYMHIFSYKSRHLIHFSKNFIMS